MPAHDLVVIGAGPGGYVAALRASQLGLDVACVEKEKALGGTCLRIGCIPSKALLESSEAWHRAGHELKEHGVVVESPSLDLKRMMKRKDRIVRALTQGVAGLFKKADVTRYEGTARLDGPGRVVVETEDGPVSVGAKHVILATGSVSAGLSGVEEDGDRIGSSTAALSYPEVPEKLVVIGAGYIGLELGSVWSRLGSEVTVLEYLDRVLPGMDGELAAAAQKAFRKQGLSFRLGVRVTGARVEGDRCVVEADGTDPIECDRVLLAVGRVAYTDGLGLESVGIETDEKGRIHVDESFRTSAEGVYAIGDVVRGLMLAHKAEEEGIACAEAIATGHGRVNYDAIPAVVYTEPEIASVGRTEEQLVSEGVAFRKGSFPFLANGRARALGSTDGFVKLLADAETDRLLGAHVIGPRAGDLIAELVAAIEFGASSEDVARTCHAHPSLSEVVKEAALAVDGRALHI